MPYSRTAWNWNHGIGNGEEFYSSVAQISRLQSGTTRRAIRSQTGDDFAIGTRPHPYNESTLEACAKALDCEPGDLLLRDPTSTAAIWDLWEQVPEQHRAQLLAMIETYIRRPPKTGT